MALRLNPLTGELDSVSPPGDLGGAGGANTEVQFNDSTALGGDATFWFDKSTNTLTVENLNITGTTEEGGESTVSVAYKSSDYTITDGDVTIIADAVSNTVTITLPASPSAGRQAVVKCVDDTFTCDVAGNGKVIDGSSSNFQLYDDESVSLIYDTTSGWNIV